MNKNQIADCWEVKTLSILFVSVIWTTNFCIGINAKHFIVSVFLELSFCAQNLCLRFIFQFIRGTATWQNSLNWMCISQHKISNRCRSSFLWPHTRPQNTLNKCSIAWKSHVNPVHSSLIGLLSSFLLAFTFSTCFFFFRNEKKGRRRNWKYDFHTIRSNSFICVKSFVNWMESSLTIISFRWEMAKNYFDIKWTVKIKRNVFLMRFWWRLQFFFLLKVRQNLSAPPSLSLLHFRL